MFFRNRFEKRLGELEEKCAKLSLEMRSLQLEWENTYDKTRHMMSRIAKRAEAMHTAAEDRGELAPALDTLSAQERVILGHLPPAQKAVQEQILRRRKQQNGGQ